jgi:hypothetical protein
MFKVLNTCYSVKALLTQLCSSETLVHELRKNNDYITQLGDIVDEIDKHNVATAIFELRSGLQSQIIIIAKAGCNDYKVYINNVTHKIDLGAEFIHHSTETKSLNDIMLLPEQDTRTNMVYLLSYALTDTPVGLKLIPLKANHLSSMLTRTLVDDPTKYADTIYHKATIALSKARQFAATRYANYEKELDEPALKLSMVYTNTPSEVLLAAGEITKVIGIGDARFCTILAQYNGTSTKGRVKKTEKYTISPKDRSVHAVGKGIYQITKQMYSSYSVDCSDLITDEIPYNLIDEGRYFVSCKCGSNLKVWISEDPKVDKDLRDNFFELLEKKLHSVFSNTIDITGSTIGNFTAFNYVQKEISEIQDAVEGSLLNCNLKALKKMVNEYKYIIRKTKALGKDVMITDKIKYQHEQGKLIYGDFSLGTDNDLMKNDIQEFFGSKLLTYFRGEEQEEEILGKAINLFFNSLDQTLSNTAKESIEINLVVNNVINITVSSKVFNHKSRFFYINNQRVNKNEVALMLKEISCYRDIASAQAFITNIGRVGLSVYMGVTSGYTLKLGTEKIFKFKKLKGRSNYELLLEGSNTKIKGKKLISCLYDQFLFNASTEEAMKSKIDDVIRETSSSTSEFIRYKLLIDDTFTSFKQQSEAVLDKKLLELDGQKIKFMIKKTVKEGVLITGLSGNTYAIAYDNSGSWVFMNPTLDIKDNVYKDGSYVCMVDQSNVKSSFSYDTVIAKMMALKNDSVISKQIYNLDEALGGFENEDRAEENTN